MTAREELAQEWRERLEDFAESELTVQQWCNFNRVTLSQYYYWRRKLAIPSPEKSANSWMAVEVVDTLPIPTAPGGVTIRIAGAAIEVAAGFDPDTLRAVVLALATPRC